MAKNDEIRVRPCRQGRTLIGGNLLEVKNLSVAVGDKQVLENISFTIGEGEVVGLLGPNGSGKTSLGLTLAGHPRYKVLDGEIKFDGKDLLKLKPNERAKAGLFMSFQSPVEIAGVPFGKFLFSAYKEVKNPAISAKDFIALLREKCAFLGIDQAFIERSVNEGFSGGEKKRAEILQLAVLEPKLAILDETDSGLDIDATKVVAKAIKKIKEKNPRMGIILITHYEQFLKQLSPSRIMNIEKGVMKV